MLLSTMNERRPVQFSLDKIAGRIWDPTKQNLQFDKFRPALGGMLGGAVSTFLLHPLDLIKTRQAVYANVKSSASNSNNYAKMGSAVKEVIKSGGGMRGLYAGVGANVVVAGASWGIYFTTYGALKTHLSSMNNGDFGLTSQLISTLGAGSATVILSNPLSVIRTKLVMQNNKASIWSTLKVFLKQNGPGALFTRGLIPSLVGVSHGAAQFIIYDHIKAEMVKRKEKGEKLTTFDTLLACSASKFAAALLTYPCQNVRACQQAAADCKTKVTAMNILRAGGVRALYAGMTPYLMHVVPNVCLVFLVYEAITSK